MEEKIHGKYTRIIGIMLVIALFVFGSIYSARRGNSMGAGLRFDADAFVFPERDGTFTRVEYTEINGLEYIERADYGTPDGGEVRDGVRLGKWKSESLGSYSACASERIRSAVRIKAGGITYVINVESDSTTRELYKTLQEVTASPETGISP